jgi:hypothetical protein
MELKGHLDGRDKATCDKLYCIVGRIGNELGDLPDGIESDALTQIFNDATAITVSIMLLCGGEKTSSQAVASLMRTLVDCCLTAFAFCMNPPKQAELYRDFKAVLEFRSACLQGKHVGCPLIANTPEKRESIDTRKTNARKTLNKVGLPFLKKTNPTDEDLERALAQEQPAKFRDTWYAEDRRELLRDEGMEWLHDIIYKELCSAVHSDSAASLVFKDCDRSAFLTQCLHFYSAALYRLIEASHIDVSDEHKGFLRSCYNNLQHKKS